MTTESLLYRLVYDALIEIRAAAHEGNSQTIFDLADLFHTVPLCLERIERGELSPDDVLQWLQTRAQQKGLAQWLEHRLREDQAFGSQRRATSQP